MTKPKTKGPVLLITAFEPFGGAKTNSSLIMLDELAREDWQGRVAFFGPVPVSFADAWPVIEQELRRYPDIKGVICMGQAEGTSKISLERMALNWVAARTPDNDGAKPHGPVVKDGPQILKAGFPWHEFDQAPEWECSYNAGAYVCNATMFNALAWAKEEGKMAGFIHLPLVESQKGDPGLSEHAPRMKDDIAQKSLARIIQFALDSVEPELALAPKKAPELRNQRPAGPQ